MEQIHVKEVNSEILIFLDKNHSTRLAALEEGARILQREVIRESTNHPTPYRPIDGYNV